MEVAALVTIALLNGGGHPPGWEALVTGRNQKPPEGPWDTIDTHVVNSLPEPSRAHAGIKVIDFKPFNPINKRTECTYHEESTGKLKRVTKGVTGIIIKLCNCNKTEEIENKLETDVEEFAMCGRESFTVRAIPLGSDPSTLSRTSSSW